jgi:hypothetical protein
MVAVWACYLVHRTKDSWFSLSFVVDQKLSDVYTCVLDTGRLGCHTEFSSTAQSTDRVGD